jgi:hypothetical protein
MAFCPLGWLLAPVARGDHTPRWAATGVILREPTDSLSLPVRDIRVMYGLLAKLYEGFLKHQIPQAHELFVPIETLAKKDSHKDPKMQALVSRTAPSANYLAVV